MKYNMDGVEALRNAIVEQACKDYISIKKYLLQREAKGYDIKITFQYRQLLDLQEWFRSEKFERFALTHSGDYYIRKLDELAEKKSVIHRRAVKKNEM